ncbi:hypothetical protein FSP39_018675 [Pinctada imbricata]|uniref:Centrosomal protein 20 n=1 Tax=Pinctada imbricata TaxID=66713 RepID=A0AA89BXK8_PINIB|nr:hypothetical protein FSP39_018675 [Pinctada imbricata]
MLVLPKGPGDSWCGARERKLHTYHHLLKTSVRNTLLSLLGQMHPCHTQTCVSVIKETLENRGSLGQIKARIRAEVFSALDDQAEIRPPLSNENMIINELIREYLEFNKYKYSSSVLVAESGQPKAPLGREFLSRELNIREDRQTSTVPLLYGILSHYLKDNRHDRSRSPQRSQNTKAAFLEQLEREMSPERSQMPLEFTGGKR